MADVTTWIIVAAVVVAVAAIVIASVAVSRRRRRLEQSVDRDATDGRAHPTGDVAPPETEEALGDRSEVFHRARRGF